MAEAFFSPHVAVPHAKWEPGRGKNQTYGYYFVKGTYTHISSPCTDIMLLFSSGMSAQVPSGHMDTQGFPKRWK